MRMLNPLLAALVLSVAYGRTDTPVYVGASKMITAAETMTNSNSFANARVGFGGNARGVDGSDHYIIEIERTEGPVLFGEYRYLWAENQNDFDIEISSFGYVHHRDVGTLDRRVVFSATECKAIEQLIRSFFANPDVFKKKFIRPPMCLELVFTPGWIIQ